MVLRDDEDRVAVRDDEGNFLLGGVGRPRHVRGAAQQDSRIANHPLGPVVGNDGRMLPRRKPETDQSGAQSPGEIVELTVAAHGKITALHPVRLGRTLPVDLARQTVKVGHVPRALVNEAISGSSGWGHRPLRLTDADPPGTAKKSGFRSQACAKGIFPDAGTDFNRASPPVYAHRLSALS